MFCKTMYYALIVMMEAAQVYRSNKRVNLAFVSQKHSIPTEALESVVELLRDKHLICFEKNELYLQVIPNEITVWQIVVEVAEDNIFRERYFSPMQQAVSTSTVTMLHKEREKVLKIIENKLSRHTLSDWSEKAKKTIYI